LVSKPLEILISSSLTTKSGLVPRDKNLKGKLKLISFLKLPKLIFIDNLSLSLFFFNQTGLYRQLGSKWYVPLPVPGHHGYLCSSVMMNKAI
jgi:hypothetical protein